MWETVDFGIHIFTRFRMSLKRPARTGMRGGSERGRSGALRVEVHSPCLTQYETSVMVGRYGGTNNFGALH